MKKKLALLVLLAVVSVNAYSAVSFGRVIPPVTTYGTDGATQI